MAEQLYAGQIPISDFPGLIAGCPFPPEALVLVEHFPEYVIDDRSRPQDLLRFIHYIPEFSFASYTSGRIFHSDGELRWEKQGAMMRVVYHFTPDTSVGPAPGSELFSAVLQRHGLREKNQELAHLVLQEKAYSLFGERLKQDDLQKMGLPTDQVIFAQVRIPRILDYPVEYGLYVNLLVREYLDPSTGQTALYRFKDLQPFQHLQPEEEDA